MKEIQDLGSISRSSLETYSDAELISQVKQKACNDSYLEICRRYENVFYKVCQKYTPTLVACGLNPSDIYKEKDYIVYHCIKTFDETKKTKFSTWIGNYARYLCLNSINAKRFVLPVDSDSLQKHVEDNQVQEDYSEKTKKENIRQYIHEVLDEFSDKRISEVIKLRYLEDEKKTHWNKIAKNLNISSQTAIHLHHKGMILIKRKLNKMISQNDI